MFDISWSELLILGIVTLVFVGPKELPVFLRTLGRYAGMARRHANEFKAQFDAAMREAELDSMRKEVEQMQSSINAEVMKAKTSLNDAASASRVDAAMPPPPAAASATLPTPPLPTPASEMAGSMPASSANKTES
ncbi:Sec-independent protein translocase protein TatB [Hyphomicrobium sp.]|uniref:Sec-independent protein translocase protein TatB n=1 Tax=Hyphomicrobium sp. TaxID=82 RepID=UPI000FBFB8F1|nr:Sec-independent protein translocase protein TatB [Hyphomicrobium sp.]RUO97957.1 MAG: twin-arginine translocase subunit TatB [Hyphomicrobium sp.]